MQNLRAIMIGLFLSSFSALALEIALVRLLSVTTWYYLSFFAVSTAMLGMTAGGTRVYLCPRESVRGNFACFLSSASLHFALSIPLSLLLLCLIPLKLYPSIISLFSLLITTATCALPFYFAGTIISAVLAHCDLPIGKLYASDLVGAAAGCLFVIGGLEVFDGSSFILLCGCPAALAAWCFSWREPGIQHRYAGLGLALFFLCAAVANSLTSFGIRPVIVKGMRIEPAGTYVVEKWNSFSRVAVYGQRYASPHYWGRSPRAPETPIYQYPMNIDGEAGTVMCRFNGPEDIVHLRYDVTNVGYYLGRKGRACIIGVGGGRDIQSALAFGHDHVTGIELNPIFVDLLEGEFRGFAGLADRPDVKLVRDEARSYLSRARDRYALIQMSLIDTWAATGVGAFSLSENALYTVEAWRLFLDRLEDNGIYTVSRWHSQDNIGETGRALSLAVAALLARGVENPSHHLALITAERISTLLVSRQPFSAGDVELLEKTCIDLDFRFAIRPDKPPADLFLRKFVEVRTQDDLAAVVEGADLNCSPPTDESPYFFNMLRLGKLGEALSPQAGVIRGNLIATLTLLALVLTLSILVVATVILPLTLTSRPGRSDSGKARILWAGAVYFSAIGAGFMVVEIALIQRLTVFLSHPLYALGILLFTLIASTGIGSLTSEHLPLTRPPWLYCYPLIALVSIVGLKFILAALMPPMGTAPIWIRIAVSVVLIFPIGLLLGLFFPTGMRLVRAISPEEIPWYWALNSIFGVLCSALAVLVSSYGGIGLNFYLAGACYGAVAIVQLHLHRAALRAELHRFGN